MDLSLHTKITIALSLIFIAILRLIYHDILGERMDTVFFALIVFAFFVLVLPWQKLKTFKTAGVEISLENPEVQAAIIGLGLNRVEDEFLRNKLLNLEKELEIIRGSRVIWIDDKPKNILGARRMLRALEVDITTVNSSEMAKEILEIDNDFDLIISDVQRKGESYKEVEGGIEIHEGVNFIVALRKNPDPNISAMPVIFYAAYDWKRLVEFTRPARELQPEAKICNSIEDFLIKVIRTLAEERSKPITYNEQKSPTAVG